MARKEKFVVTTTKLRSLRRLTIFDWLVLLVLLATAIFLALFVLKRERWVEVDVKVAKPEWWWQSQEPPHWLVDTIRPGDAQYDVLGRKIAEVERVRAYESGGSKKVAYLTLRLKVSLDKRKKIFKFNYKPLLVGKGIDLELNNVGFTGLVTYIQGVPDNRIWEDKIVRARVVYPSSAFPETLGAMPWIARAIQKGDHMKDNRGRVVAEVLEKTVQPAEKVVKTADGRVLLRRDPLKKDVFLTLRLKTVRQGGVNYFLDDEKVKVGQAVSLYLPRVDIWPIITKIVK